MNRDPETRPTLLLRLKDRSDATAWNEFVTIYRPVIMRMAIYKGIQSTDAEDIAQQVLLSVSKSISGWVPNNDRSRFRTWLQQVVRNATLNAITRRPKDQAIGGTTGLRYLESRSVDENDAAQFDLEWRRRVFRWVAQQVRGEFQPATWQAFWMTAVDGVSPGEAASKTNKTIGAVYVAKSRVMQRIQEIAAEFEGDEHDRYVADDDGKTG
ncbi:MAG: RNA polymerase sigma factor [Pirellula sp.]